MRDLQSSFWIKAKGAMFLLIGATSASLLILENFSIKTVVLLALCIWSFARAYYFAFYVIEHYIDPEYHFAGLWDATTYLWNPEAYKKKKGLPSKRQTP